MQYVITGVCALCLLKANNPVFDSCNNAALPNFFSWTGLSPPHPLPPAFIFLGGGWGSGGGCATSLQLHVGIKYLQLYIHVFCYLVLYCLVIHVTIYTMQLYFVK